MNSLKRFFFYLTIFITGAIILIIEILGTRILAPFYGSTVFVWSSLITVTLLFIALGYFFGGKLADKKPNINLLYWIIFLGGIFILLISKIDKWVLIKTDPLGLKIGPLVASLILFFPPLFLLAIVDPFAVKIRSESLDNIGMTAGNIYSLTTLGSLVGALLTGFYLISNFSVTWILNVSAFVLIAIFFIWQIITLKK